MPAVARKRRSLLQPQPALADDAEDPFRADDHAIGARAGAAAGQSPRLPPAARRQHARALDEVVDVGVVGRIVAAGAGRDPAANRRPGEALGKVAQCQAVGAQRIFEIRTEDPGLDSCRP